LNDVQYLGAAEVKSDPISTDGLTHLKKKNFWHIKFGIRCNELQLVDITFVNFGRCFYPKQFTMEVYYNQKFDVRKIFV